MTAANRGQGVVVRGGGGASSAADQYGELPAVSEPTTGTPATLIFNPNAGSGAIVEPDALRRMLADSGYEAVHRETKRAEDLDSVLSAAEGLIVVAGGDGTFREVAMRTRGRAQPLALVPLGTANNSARSLGIEGSVKQVVAGLRNPRRIRVDLITTRGPWGEEVAVEGAGLGLFANILAAYRPKEGKSMLRAFTAAADSLIGNLPIRCRIELDDQRLDGEYLLVEAMNMRAVGPRLGLAQSADPTDGLLDLVLVRHENRDALLAYFRRLLTSGLPELPSVDLVRGRKMKINWRSSAFHVDGLSLCEDALESDQKGFSAKIEVDPGALEVWLPASPTG